MTDHYLNSDVMLKIHIILLSNKCQFQELKKGTDTFEQWILLKWWSRGLYVKLCEFTAADFKRVCLKLFEPVCGSTVCDAALPSSGQAV